MGAQYSTSLQGNLGMSQSGFLNSQWLDAETWFDVIVIKLSFSQSKSNAADTKTQQLGEGQIAIALPTHLLFLATD